MVKRATLLLVAMCCCSSAWSAGSVSGKVIQVRVDKDGRGIVTFDTQVGGAPATCRHSAYTNALSFDANTHGGKAIMALALAAKTSGSSVSAYGMGACSIYGGAWVEDWDYGVIL